MVRFLLYISGLLLFLGISSWYLYHLSIPHEAKILKLIPSKQQVINLGTSHGYDFDYRVARLNGRNACIGSNSIYYDLQVFRLYDEIELLNPDALVIIPVSYFTLGVDENRTDWPPHDCFVDFYYSFMPPKYIHNYSWQKDTEVAFYNIKENVKWKLFGTRKRPLHSRQTRAFINRHIRKHGKPRPKGFMAIGEHVAKGHLGGLDSNYVSMNTGYLKTLVSEVLASDRQPILVTTPYHEIYNKHFDGTWVLNKYYAMMNEISEEFNVPYLDYSHDSRFTSDRSLFSDADHLNKEGKRAFNTVFFQDIDEYVKKLSRSERRPEKYLLKK